MIKILVQNRNLTYKEPVMAKKIIKDHCNEQIENILGININNNIHNLSYVIDRDSSIEIIYKNSDIEMKIIRYNSVYLLAYAIKILYPQAKIINGKVIESEYYYDFANLNISTHEFSKIENTIKKIIQDNQKTEIKTLDKQTAINIFIKNQEEYKINIVKKIATPRISIYKRGDFADIIYENIHIHNTNNCKYFKLTKVSGISKINNIQIQRIYGTAWNDKKKLEKYLSTVKNAKERDHKKIGQEMDLFHFNKNAQGCVFWHQKGWKIFLSITEYIREKQQILNYEEINTPEMMDNNLWYQSGHQDKFIDHMYTINSFKNLHQYTMRPMNCPGSILVYKSKLRSYKELPMKFSEFGKVYRFEPSGSLYGLMRLRSFTQDDAHIFCTEQQLTNECKKILTLILDIYKDFGFKDIKIKFSDRPKNRLGREETWDIAEASLIQSLKEENLKYTIKKENGAFYGPKIEFTLTDILNREWQLGTIQIDFNLPERFNLHYINFTGIKQRPLMLHRALLGSIERFLGILLEHYNGYIPLWLTTTQIAIIAIHTRYLIYCTKIYMKLKKKSLKCIIETENKNINIKIRQHFKYRTPYLIIIGEKEYKNSVITVKKLNKKKSETLALNNFIDKLLYELNNKGVNHI